MTDTDSRLEAAAKAHFEAEMGEPWSSVTEVERVHTMKWVRGVSAVYDALRAFDQAQPVGDAEEWQPISTYPRGRDHGLETDWGPNALLFIPSGFTAPSSNYRILTGRLEADLWLGWCDDGSMVELTGAPSHWQRLPKEPRKEVIPHRPEQSVRSGSDEHNATAPVMGAGYPTETDAGLLARLGDDASKWASEFRQTAIRLGYSDMDEGWLLGWFANAIEHSHSLRQHRTAAVAVMGADPPWLDQWALTVHKNRLATSSLEAIKHIAREAIAFANAQPPSDDAVTEALRVFDSPGQFTKRSRWDAMCAAITAAKARSDE